MRQKRSRNVPGTHATPTPHNPWKLFSFVLMAALGALLALQFSDTFRTTGSDTAQRTSWAQSFVSSEGGSSDVARALPDRPSIFGMMVRTPINVGQALVTVQNIQSLGTKYKFHFFLLPMGDGHIPEDEWFTEKYTSILDKFNVTADLLPIFPYPSDKVKDTLHYNNWHFPLNRLSYYGMYDRFERILLTDADVVFVAPVDEVFRLTRTGVSMLPEPGQCVLPDKMSGGFLLIYPEEEEWKRMLEFAESVKDKRDPTWSNSEQSFQGHFFKVDMDQQEHPHDIVSLSHIYTFPLHDCICTNLDYIAEGGFKNLLSQQLRTVKVYHFTPGFKPWRYSLNEEAGIAWGENDPECIRPIVDLYAKHRLTMTKKLTDDEMRTLHMCRDKRDVDCEV